MARTHLMFCCQLYRDQLAAGRLFLHEHPATATSWWEPCIQYIMRMSGVRLSKAHMCQYGLVSRDSSGSYGPVLKPTHFMSNCVKILRRLSRRCPGRGGGRVHYNQCTGDLSLGDTPSDMKTSRKYIGKTLADTGDNQHQHYHSSHVHLAGGQRARAAAEYTPTLCIEILK